MKFNTPKTLFTFVIFLLFATNTNASTPKKVLTDAEMKLAMLDFSKQGFVVPNTRVKKTKVTTSSKQLPRNCLEWSASQINQRSKPYDKIISQNAKKYKVDIILIKSVITAESCFRVKALSSAGAQGLMQLIPDTAKRFGVKNSYNPEQNVRGGVKYLKFLLDRYKGDFVKTVAAYNAGEGKVDRYKGVPPYKETKQYVKNVLSTYSLLKPNNGLNQKKVAYQPPKLGQKPGRHGWQYNRKLAPHLYKKK